MGRRKINRRANWAKQKTEHEKRGARSRAPDLVGKGSAAVRQPAVGPLTGGPACVGPCVRDTTTGHSTAADLVPPNPLASQGVV